MARGRVVRIAVLHLDFKRTMGSKTREAPTKRNKVSEMGVMIPVSFSDAKNDPAARVVASKASK